MFSKLFGLLLVWAPAILLSASIYAGNPAKTATNSSELPPPNCQDLIAQFQEGEHGFDRLIDPILTDFKAVQDHLSKVTALHTCLETGLDRRSDEEMEFYYWSEYFLVFAGGYQTDPDGSIFQLVDLTESDDPAVLQLRQDVMLPPPDGLIFVRFYSSQEAMPDLIQSIFGDPSIAGVTVMTRYVAVLRDEGPSWRMRALQAQSLPATISHELVHAYVNATLGPEDVGKLPRWYHEGVAIYFSRSGEDHSVVTPQGTVSVISPADYRQYELNFKYLESRLGRRRLLERVRQSVQEADETVLLQDLNIRSGDELVELSLTWVQNRMQRRVFLVLVGVFVIGFFLVRLAPEVECVCGYQGSRGDFASGLCPHCGRKVQIPPSVLERALAHVAPVCEICSRRIWPWRSEERHPQSDKVKMWVDEMGGLDFDRPRQAIVTVYCSRCRERSEEIERDTSIEISADKDEMSRRIRPLYGRWLKKAPSYPGASEAEVQVFSFEYVLDQIVQTALRSEYFSARRSYPGLQLRTEDGWSPLEGPPSGYHNILQKTIYHSGVETKVLGSVFSINQEKIAILWQLEE